MGMGRDCCHVEHSASCVTLQPTTGYCRGASQHLHNTGQPLPSGGATSPFTVQHATALVTAYLTRLPTYACCFSDIQRFLAVFVLPTADSTSSAAATATVTAVYAAAPPAPPAGGAGAGAASATTGTVDSSAASPARAVGADVDTTRAVCLALPAVDTPFCPLPSPLLPPVPYSFRVPYSEHQALVKFLTAAATRSLASAGGAHPLLDCVVRNFTNAWCSL